MSIPGIGKFVVRNGAKAYLSAELKTVIYWITIGGHMAANG
jgi:hypothetical protein